MRWQTIFQSTLPVRGATARTRSVCSVWYYFNPRSPCGERRRTVWVQHTEIAISIHAPRAGSDPHPGSCGYLGRLISIHAPRAGSDLMGGFQEADSCISIHAPRAGSDDLALLVQMILIPFQSTLPVRGATKAKFRRTAVRAFQSTLPVRGATLPFLSAPMPSLISIHAPRAGSDWEKCRATQI